VIVHVVLLTPRPDLTAADRAAAIAALANTTAAVPEVRRFRIGRRVRHGLPGYEQHMRAAYEIALLLELDDLAALTRYLRTPAHSALGHLFATATSEAIAYDYDVVEAIDAARVWSD
jgi:hypothetical protein